MGRANPDYRARFEGTDRLLRRYMAGAGVRRLPPTLDGYLRRVVAPTLEGWKREGAIGVKFAAAYHRRLDFEEVPEGRARRVYARFIEGGEPPAADYKALQDFLFRYWVGKNTAG